MQPAQRAIVSDGSHLHPCIVISPVLVGEKETRVPTPSPRLRHVHSWVEGHPSGRERRRRTHGRCRESNGKESTRVTFRDKWTNECLACFSWCVIGINSGRGRSTPISADQTIPSQPSPSCGTISTQSHHDAWKNRKKEEAGQCGTSPSKEGYSSVVVS